MDAGEERQWSTETGRVALEMPARGVLVFRISGFMDPGFVAHFGAAAAPFVATNEKVDFFFDTTEMSGFHPKFRERMTDWHAAVKPQTRSASVLITSKFVAM